MQHPAPATPTSKKRNISLKLGAQKQHCPTRLYSLQRKTVIIWYATPYMQEKWDNCASLKPETVRQFININNEPGVSPHLATLAPD